MKNLLLLLVFIFGTIPVFAQVHLGLSSGANLSFWKWGLKSIHHSIDFEPAMGGRFAVLGEWQMNRLLGFRAEFGAQIKANKMTKNLLFESDILAGNFNGTPAYFREYYQYWESSLLIQISPIKKIRAVYLLAGSTTSRLEQAWNKISGTEAGKKFSSTNSINIKDQDVNHIAFAADFGLGGNIPLGKNSKLKVEARYQHNFSNLSNNDNVEARINPLFLFNLGYLHRL